MEEKMKFKSKRQTVLLGGLVFVLGIVMVLIYQTSIVEKVEAGDLAPDVAVARALTVAEEYALPYGGLRGKPTEIYGKVMTYAEANGLILGEAIDPNSAEADLADKQVWLILFNGDIVEHVPAAIGGDPPAKEVQHSQMTIVLDALTGDMIQKTLLSPQKEFDVQTLSALEYPGESSFEVFPPQPIQTEEPLPPATEPAQ